MSQHLIKLYEQEAKQSQSAINELDLRMRKLIEQLSSAEAELATAQALIESAELLIAETEVAGDMALSRLQTAKRKLANLKSQTGGA